MNSLSNIEVIFLPPNTTSILQPMDSGIIRNFKAYFNGYKLSHISDMLDGENPVEDCFKSINLRDVAVFTSLSWKKVTKKTIYNCFSHSGWISRISGDEKDSLCETFKSEYSDFIKENKIIDSITFDKYCEEDFDLKQINEEDFDNTEDPESQNSDKEELDQGEITNIEYEDLEKSFSTILWFIEQGEEFNIEAKCKLLELKRVLRRKNIKKRGILAYLIKR